MLIEIDCWLESHLFYMQNMYMQIPWHMCVYMWERESKLPFNSLFFLFDIYTHTHIHIRLTKWNRFPVTNCTDRFSSILDFYLKICDIFDIFNSLIYWEVSLFTKNCFINCNWLVIISCHESLFENVISFPHGMKLYMFLFSLVKLRTIKKKI